MRDLAILVADKDMEQAVEKTVRRAPSLGIRKIDFEIYGHPCRDNGCRTASLDVLRPLADKYQHALVLFDHEGCGAEHQFLDDVEAQVLHDLEINGWQDRAQVIAIDPELEIWMWSDSPEVDRVLGWAGRQPPVRTWLAAKGFEIQSNGKPTRPKEALALALREVRKQPSPALFAQIAEKVSLNRCTDRSFVRLRDILLGWFPAPN
jgi:hypothetical protein